MVSTKMKEGAESSMQKSIAKNLDDRTGNGLVPIEPTKKLLSKILKKEKQRILWRSCLEKKRET